MLVLREIPGTGEEARCRAGCLYLRSVHSALQRGHCPGTVGAIAARRKRSRRMGPDEDRVAPETLGTLLPLGDRADGVNRDPEVVGARWPLRVVPLGLRPPWGPFCPTF